MNRNITYIKNWRNWHAFQAVSGVATTGIFHLSNTGLEAFEKILEKVQSYFMISKSVVRAPNCVWAHIHVFNVFCLQTDSVKHFWVCVHYFQNIFLVPKNSL